MPSDSGASPQVSPWNSSRSRYAPDPQCPALRWGSGSRTDVGALTRHLVALDGHGELLGGLADDVVLEQGFLALGVADDDDPLGAEAGERVLQREQRVGLAGVAGRVDAL